MENISQKARGNAVISYFLVIISLSFLFHKDEQISHPFVKHHVRVAFLFHLTIAGILFIMSYPLFPGVYVLGFSLQDVITSSLLLVTFIGILFGMLSAHNGKKLYF